MKIKSPATLLILLVISLILPSCAQKKIDESVKKEETPSRPRVPVPPDSILIDDEKLSEYLKKYGESGVYENYEFYYEKVPVDSAHRRIYDDCIMDTLTYRQGNKTCKHTEYVIYEFFGIKSLVHNVFISCWDFGDLTVCVTSTTDTDIHQTLVISPDKLTLLYLPDDVEDPLQNWDNPFALRKALERPSLKKIPLAEYDKNGIKEEFRGKRWRSDFKYEFIGDSIKFTNTDGKDFSFSIASPVKGVKNWQDRLPPFLIYDINTWSKLFWWIPIDLDPNQWYDYKSYFQ